MCRCRVTAAILLSAVRVANMFAVVSETSTAVLWTFLCLGTFQKWAFRKEKFDTHVIQSAYFLAARGDRCGVYVEEEKSCTLALPRSAAERFEGARGRSKWPISYS